MLINNKSYRTIWFDEKIHKVKIIDQTQLPFCFSIVTLNNLKDVINAINKMQVRGAPLIGATAAYGIYLAYRDLKDKSRIQKEANKIKNTRPTAINLFWAVDKMLSIIKESLPLSIIEKNLLDQANKICEKDIERCINIGEYGLRIIEQIHQEKGKVNILTHCNAGWLAAVDWGTALAPIFKAKKNNIPIHVWVDETRPRNQGFNLTAWELINENIDCSLIVDNVGGHLMQHNQVDMCIVGTDRTTLSGDVCNKIGTYLKALAAYDNNIPFYVSAPISSIDFNIRDGVSEIPIEKRDPAEVSSIWGIDKNKNMQTVSIVPKKSKSVNYAFDVTPSKYISKLITEKGIVDANEISIKGLK